MVFHGIESSFEEVRRQGPPQPSVENEDNSDFPVEIYLAHPNPEDSIVTGLPEGTEPRVFLHRRDDAQQAYVRTSHLGLELRENRGSVVVCQVCPRNTSSGLGFVASLQQVVVKMLRKQVINEIRARGGVENPVKEISLMQELGDNKHVIKPIEVLEDDTFWYIVLPKARCTLYEELVSTQPFERERSRAIFRQLLNIVIHLAQYHVCHRDLSPDNFVFLDNGQLVAIDFGMALRVPVDPVTGHRFLMTPQGNFGTAAYMPPEVFMNDVYDSVFADLWAVSLILFNMLTNTIPFCLPHFEDMNFRFFIMARGLASPLNDLAMEVFHEVFPPSAGGIAGRNPVQIRLRCVAQALQRLDDPTIYFLASMLQLNPSQRWTLAQVYEFANGNDFFY